jgi:hypothetical protein
MIDGRENWRLMTVVCSGVKICREHVEAEQMHRQTLELKRKVLGLKHPHKRHFRPT